MTTIKKHTLLQDFTHFVSLNVLGMIGLSCYILADTFFVANGLGPTGLAALNLSISIYSFINGIGLMLGIGAATKFTIFKANGEHEKADATFTHAIILGLLAGAIFLLLGIFAAPNIAKLLGANENTLEMASTYLKVILCFAPFFITNNVLIAFVRNDGNPKLSMIAMLAGSFSNIILDYVFVFPLSMGMFGAALATGIAPVIGILILSTHFIRKRNSFSLVKCKILFSRVLEICSLGTSALITELSSGIVLIIFNLMILKISGNIGVAAYGIVANVALVAISVFTGIAQGMQPIASRSYGLKQEHDLKKILKYAAVLALAVAAFIYVIAFVFSDGLISIFNSEGNEALADFAKSGIRIYFLGFIFAGINIVLAAFYSATEKASSAFIISITRGGAAIIPLVLIFASAFGMNGVWLSFPCAEAITLAIGIVLIKRSNIAKKACN